MKFCIKKTIRFFKKHIQIDKLDDIYTFDEKKELMAHWNALEDAPNKSLDLTLKSQRRSA